MPKPPDPPQSTAALSLLELRRHLLRQAGTLQVRAQELREKGARRIASRMSTQSERLRLVAKIMALREDDEEER